MPITATPVVDRSIGVPHLDAVEDFNTAQCLRLAWDTIAKLQAQVSADADTIAHLVTAVNTLEDTVVALRNACQGAGIFSEVRAL